VQIVSASQATPTPDDLALLNNDPTNGGLVTNSWARWAPFVQNYKGGQILWLTVSSTRSYGLRIDNQGTANCYPKESPVYPPYSTREFDQTQTPACSRAQLWMAAVKLDANAVQAQQDVSFPAFWLPFQDLTTNNHLGQWAQKSYTGTCAAADAGGGGCAPGFCCDNGGCTPCQTTPPPPAPTCAVNANCAAGTCCNNGQCGACADAGPADGGGPSGCQTCLDCNGQACVASQCGACTNSAQCCAPLECVNGTCGYVVH
jgi:hypothetical protein